MSIIEPNINDLLDNTEYDRFLLCSVASRRAHDINEMMRGQRTRALEMETALEIARANNRKPLSIAFQEVADGTVGYDPDTLDLEK
ncbi:MAG: DNA-directed RNA polymerase subunit omega [Eggerthellales bacterium]|nr:DNA-directed RNA polymerase subunit omega [Eggerthellales bacterium]